MKRPNDPIYERKTIHAVVQVDAVDVSGNLHGDLRMFGCELWRWWML
jgi:hypothetical protein